MRSGAMENAEICGALLDDLIERGLSKEKSYLFVLDGARPSRKRSSVASARGL
ncbi:MAG: hypothetical protein ACM3VT_12990 [Solirubrobacterales bacterium]